MNQKQFIISSCFIFFLATDMSYGGPLIYRMQQKKTMSQRPSQAEYDQYQQQQGQAQGQQAPAPPTYQQTVDQRNQAIAQAILDAHHDSASNVSVPFGNNPDINEAQQPIASPTATPDAQDTVDLSEVWKKLDTKSTVWALLIDDQAKLLTVSEYIDRFHKEGVRINLPPLHYVQMIDQIIQVNPQILQQPFGQLLQILAIVDYDFDNGMNKDDLARKVLGEAGFETNKKRFTQQGPGQ